MYFFLNILFLLYLQYFTRMLRRYLNCNEILKIFLTSFCNILCYVDGNKIFEKGLI